MGRSSSAGKVGPAACSGCGATTTAARRSGSISCPATRCRQARRISTRSTRRCSDRGRRIPVRSSTTPRATGPPTAPTPTLAAVSQLPPVMNTRSHVSADARYSLSRHVTAGLVYWYEKYSVDDYAFSPATLTGVAQPAFLTLRYLYRPYNAHTIWLRASYLF